MKLKLLYVLALFTTLSFAQQIPDDIKPPSWSLENLEAIRPHKLSSFDVKSLMDEDLINDKDKSKPWRFGHEIYVDHSANDVGEWTTLPNGDRIWRMTYKSEGAHTLNFMFDIFWIPEGATLYVYNNEKNDLIRPFTHHNNNPEEILGTWFVKGDQAWIEYYQPANVRGEAKLTVGSVVHGYRTAETYQKALNDSGSCNQDVDCDIAPTTDPFDINTRKEEVKKAVAMLLTSGGLCTGSLVNNTNNDGTPYFLTANHCGGGEGAWAFRFNWRSPNPSCGTTTNSTNGSFNQTVSGSIRRAASSESDMKLVEITDTSFFNNNPDVVWSGWNRSTTQTPQINFGVHHPSGDIQKACRDDGGAFRNVTSFNGNPTTEMWRINDWDLGVTEGGSSGSGLFNEDGHLIGMLSGGSAQCVGTNDNGGFDVYGRFGVGWDFGTTAASRLRDWLDPGNTGVTTLDIFPLLQQFEVDATVSAGASNEDLICNDDFTPQVTLINRGLLTLTSADVSYSIDSEPDTVINFTGSLLSDEDVVLASPVYSNLSPGSHTFTVSVTNPNATTDENTVNDVFAFTFTVSPEFSTNEVILNLTTDNFGNEVTWQLSNSGGTVVASGPTIAYANATAFQETITIPAFDDCYTFSMLDSFGDGICCTQGNGTYNLQDDSGNVIITGGDYGSGESVTFKAQDPLSVDEFGLERLINLYPNPVNDNLNVVLSNIGQDVSYTIYNTLGQKVSSGNLSSNSEYVINMTQQESGIYFIKLSTQSNSITKKVVKK
ncbi:T9SS type A sorting domain-containing protein [Winogradskyella sp. UBA3174]|uniref:T9SS type A sorting domain-containing protein n=1 Tax=Winogradskyella sp. UBA3174 TaxID=1947785 RepID=UPI0025FDAF5B|nr:T9SS type A sorting domain-containing protein [Winogradskyella sp. UBA3174]